MYHSLARNLKLMASKIIHIDMDYFYAQVEERDNPELKDKPIAVGGKLNGRGVLTTCNYLARKYGLHSAMPTTQALKRCKDLILLPVNMEKYKAASQQIREVFYQFTDLVEPLSLDEAYLDVTKCSQYDNSATRIAQAIKKEIKDKTGLTASAGVAPCKFLAKVASDWNKPDGLFVIPPDKVAEFVIDLPIKVIFGVGKVTQQKLAKLNIVNCGDLQQLSREALTQQFGKFGTKLYDYARGIDEREVNPDRIRQSVSIERTYPQDLPDLSACLQQLPTLGENLKRRLTPYSDRQIKGQFVKIKAHDFTQTTLERQCVCFDETAFESLMTEAFQRLQKPVRLLGVGVRFVEEKTASIEQMVLF